MANILYVLGVTIPDEVRAEKICQALLQDGHTVTILSRWFEGAAEREIYQNLSIIRVGKGRKHWMSSPISANPIWQKAIANAVIEFQPQLIITREMLLAEASAYIGRKKNIPTIIDMAEHYPGAMRGWKKYQSKFYSRFIVNNLKIIDLIEKRAVYSADGIIVVCSEQAERLHKQYLYSNDKSVVVHNTPELALFQNVNKTCSSPPSIFAHHGFFTLDRGLLILAKGFEEIALDNKKVQLILSGTGETYEDVVSFANSSPVKLQIQFPGKYSLSSRAELYNKIDVGVLPYVLGEHINNTIANKLFDYMACGKPVIVSEAKPMKRIVEETGAGIVADCSTPAKIAEAIRLMINSDVHKMSENGRKATENKYNWAVDSERLCKFVRKFIA